MPTIEETELDGQEVSLCTNCGDFEGAIFLCGEGYLCEQCFSKLAEIEEEDLFDESVPLLEYEIPQEQIEKAKANLRLMRFKDEG